MASIVKKMITLKSSLSQVKRGTRTLGDGAEGPA